MSTLVPSTSYQDWSYILRLVKSRPIAVNVLDFTKFFQVHGYGPLDQIYLLVDEVTV